MRTDIYLKAVLTVIAIALVWIAVALTRPVTATENLIQVDIVRLGGKLVWQALPVTIQK